MCETLKETVQFLAHHGYRLAGGRCAHPSAHAADFQVRRGCRCRRGSAGLSSGNLHCQRFVLGALAAAAVAMHRVKRRFCRPAIG